ncbi:MAG: hypothetical protein RPU94_03985, partial [Candidatus Sedimenticola sp. (ex Thyasira tokunagai)]
SRDDLTSRSYAIFGFPLALCARRASSIASRLPGTNRLGFQPSLAVSDGRKADGTSKRTEGDWSFTPPLPEGEGRGVGESRWRSFSREYIRDQKGDSLDISWIKDEDSVDAASLPEPDVLAAEAMGELTEALRELDGLMQALGAGDEAQVQRTLLIESLGLESVSAE